MIVVIILVIFVIAIAVAGWRNSKSKDRKKELSTSHSATPTQTASERKRKGELLRKRVSQFLRDNTKKARELIARNWAFFLGYIVCHLLAIYFMSFDTYWKYLGGHWLFWLDQWIPIAIFFLLRKQSEDGKKWTIHPVGQAIILILVVGTLWTIGKKFIWPKVVEAHNQQQELARSYSRNVSRSTSSNKPFRLSEEQREVRRQVEAILDRKDLKPGQKKLLMDLCECESTWHQFEDDGVTPYYARTEDENGKIVRSDVNAIGVMQINMDAHNKPGNNEVERCTAETGESCDPTTLEGNVNMGIWILNTYGPERWMCYHTIAGDFDTEAPLPPKWKRIAVKKHTFIDTVSTTEGILVRSVDGDGNVGIPQEYHQGQKIHFGKSFYFLEVQSIEKGAVKVHVSRK